MAKNSVFDYDTVAANNLDIASISLAENITKPSDVNNIMRNELSQLAQWRQDLGGGSTTAGTNTITVTANQAFTAYAAGQRFLFKLGGTAAAGATTLNITPSGGAALGAKPVKFLVAGVATDPTAGQLTSGNYAEFQYDGTNMNVLGSAATTFATNAQAATATSTAVALTPANLAQERGYSNAPFSNLSLVASVAASALTIAVKGQDGNDPSATNPVYVSFRSATLTSGLNAQLVITSALSLVISSGSTLGMTSAVAATLAIGIVNDAGTARLAVQNPLTLPLVDGIVSTTAEGGAGAADSAGVLYTGTAATSKAITYVGLAIVTEATAGTWATAPSTVQVGPAPAVNNAYPVGRCVAWVNFNGTGTVAIRASFNVSSITDNGVGTYAVNFSNALTDAKYGFSVSGGDSTNTLSRPVFQNPNGSPTASAFAMVAQKLSDSSVADYDTISAAFYR